MHKVKVIMGIFGFATMIAMAPAANAGFIGRSQAVCSNVPNCPNTTINISTPSGTASGDMLVLVVASYSTIPTVSGSWQNLGSCHNAHNDAIAAFASTATGAATYSVTGNYPKAILRAYRGPVAVDASACAGGNTIPVLGMPSVANEQYVGVWMSDGDGFTQPGDLSNWSGDLTQWGSGEGDKLVSSAPAPETANGGTHNTAFGIMLTNNQGTHNNPPSGPQPYGSIAPPAGKQWQVVFDDEFNQDSSINQALWNAGPDGYPLCHTPGIASNNNGAGCGWGPGNGTTTIQDCLGYAGGPKGNECVNVFSGSDFVTGQSFYNSISQGVGLVVMSANDPSDPAGNNYFDTTWTGLQNYGKLSLHPGAFVEWYAKMPSNVSGEGNGLHTDLWCTGNNRTTLAPSSNNVELDVNEKNPSTNGRNSTTFNVAEGGHAQVGSYGVPGGGNLDAGFHHYAAQWFNSGGSGSWKIYADGGAVSGAIGVSASGWQSGLYCFAGWMQEGRGLNGGTSTNNPLYVQYFRAWQAQ